MTGFLRRWAWTSLFVGALGLTGCNLLALPFFIFGPEPTVDAGLKRLASDDKRKPIKVMILAHNSGMDMKPEFSRIDRDVAERLRGQLKAGFEYKENVVVMNPRQAEDFKNQNPGWYTRDFEEIGKQFGADYFIYLEIRSMGLYEQGSSSTLFRGRTDISVTLIDVNNPDNGPMHKDFVCQYPSETRVAIPVEDIPPDKFRNDFLNYVAKRMSWYFTSHPTSAAHDCE